MDTGEVSRSFTWLPHRLRTTRLESWASWAGRTFTLLRDKFSFSNSNSSHSSAGTSLAKSRRRKVSIVMLVLLVFLVLLVLVLLLEELLYLQSAASQTQNVVSKLFDGVSSDSVRWRQTVLAPPLLLLHLLLTHCSSHPSLPPPPLPPASSPPVVSTLVLFLSFSSAFRLTEVQTEILNDQAELYCPDSTGFYCPNVASTSYNKIRFYPEEICVFTINSTWPSRWVLFYHLISGCYVTVQMPRCYYIVQMLLEVQVLFYCPKRTLLSRCYSAVQMLSRCYSCFTGCCVSALKRGRPVFRRDSSPAGLVSVLRVVMISCGFRSLKYDFMSALFPVKYFGEI